MESAATVSLCIDAAGFTSSATGAEDVGASSAAASGNGAGSATGGGAVSRDRSTSGAGAFAGADICAGISDAARISMSGTGRTCQAMPIANASDAAIPAANGQRRRRGDARRCLASTCGCAGAVSAASRAAPRITASSAADGDAALLSRARRSASVRSSGVSGSRSDRFMGSAACAVCPSRSAIAISRFRGRRR